MNFLEGLKPEDINGKKAILRADFDVSVKAGKVAENFRIRAQKETVDYLINKGAKVLLVAHIGHEVSNASFGPITEEISEILGQTLTLVPHSELGNVNLLFKECPVLLLDNIRQNKSEIENREDFAQNLSREFDFYINNDFAVSHRRHASVAAITEFLPSYAGFLMKKELENLSRAISAPAAGKILVLGGAKISTKLPLIKNFLGKAERILIGGALANNFFAAKGIKIGRSTADINVGIDEEVLTSENISLPTDILVTDDKNSKTGGEVRIVSDIAAEEVIADIGPETTKIFVEAIRNSKMVIWNGPMGLAEIELFSEGTRAVASAVSEIKNSIIGGGDTITAVDKFSLLDKYGFVSTGGGALLEFLAGERLPGLEALNFY